MSSGVGVCDSALTAFEDMKLKRKYAYIVYEITDKGISPTVVKERSENNKSTQDTYLEFISLMPADEGRYGVFDLEYDSADGKRSKLVFLMWAPDSSKIKTRMMYASSKQALRQRLEGIHTEIQCTDPEELSFETVFAQIAPEGASPLGKEE